MMTKKCQTTQRKDALVEPKDFPLSRHSCADNSSICKTTTQYHFGNAAGISRKQVGHALIKHINQQEGIITSALHLLAVNSQHQDITLGMDTVAFPSAPSTQENQENQNPSLLCLSIQYEQLCLGFTIVKTSNAHWSRHYLTYQNQLLKKQFIETLFQLHHHNNNAASVIHYREEFYKAVAYAIKNYHCSDKLQHCLLLKCALISNGKPGFNMNPLSTLRSIIKSHIEVMQQCQKTKQWGFLLQQIYLDQSINQEQMAERINKSASTLRRQLKLAKNHLSAELFQEELTAQRL